MDTAIANVKLLGFTVLTLLLLVSLVTVFTARISARSAARSAAHAAAAAVPDGWDCQTESIPARAVSAAASAVYDRLENHGRLTLRTVEVSADPATCTVVAAVEYVPLRLVWAAEPRRAVGCEPAAGSAVLELPSVCGQA